MELRPLGNTGLDLPLLALGAGEWGGPEVDGNSLARLLDQAAEQGPVLVDTAPSYGQSEERLGRLLRTRVAPVLVCTKVGYGVPGVPDWTADCITRGVDQALARLGRDCLEIVLLHSCPAEVLRHNGVIEALDRAREQGKVRVVGYSGENGDLDQALDHPAISCVMTSLNPCDQGVLDNLRLARRLEQGLGWLVKRPLANGVWRFAHRPERPDLAEYWRRWHELGLGEEVDPLGRCLGFAGSVSSVSSVVVGMGAPERYPQCLAALARGLADPECHTRWRSRWGTPGPGWPGLV